MIMFAAAAGGLGALARAGIEVLIDPRRPAWQVTLGINIVGSFLLGCATALPAAWLAVVGTGFLGGFTTFSSASWQIAREIGRRRRGVAAAYLMMSVLGCVAAAWLGVGPVA